AAGAAEAMARGHLLFEWVHAREAARLAEYGPRLALALARESLLCPGSVFPTAFLGAVKRIGGALAARRASGSRGEPPERELLAPFRAPAAPP
ncbi:MAG: hypothetical protein SF028_07205, partial [Candidatus Sumerlaeia bacterium]|nr:hypothetical protein [Candidatus Sumerlaeia bacterium]